MVMGTEITFLFDSLPFFLAAGFIGSIVKAVAGPVLGKVFGGSSSSKSTSTSGPPAYAQEAGNMLLEHIKKSGGLPTGQDLLKAAGPGLNESLTHPGINWYETLMGGGGEMGKTGADGTMVNNAMGGDNKGMDSAFGLLMNQSQPGRMRQGIQEVMSRPKSEPGAISSRMADLFSQYYR